MLFPFYTTNTRQISAPLNLFGEPSPGEKIASGLGSLIVGDRENAVFERNREWRLTFNGFVAH
jgi:hypothetical protein